MAKPKNLKQQIIDLHNQGSTYTQIQKALNCSKGSIAYHLGKDTKNKAKITNKKFKINNPILIRLYRFCYTKPTYSKLKINIPTLYRLLYQKLYAFYKKHKLMSNKLITVQEFMEKYKDGFKCYLTGEPIDINNYDSYEFDHIIPSSRGGDNSLSNLGLCKKQANRMKSDLLLNELLDECKQILTYNGYKIIKNDANEI